MKKKTHHEDKFKINQVLKKIQHGIFLKKDIKSAWTLELTR